tara:strand:+ start:149 stop:724 length:576 start_codon:yes stop_codon:yes gene_type:complete
MKLLSIDVGIRNLAYVIINVEDVNVHHIEQWDVLELCGKCEKASNVSNVIIGENMKNIFNEKFSELVFDKIIIENQIGQNAIKMKTIQGMINMYFIMNGYNESKIINYNAVHKLKPFQPKDIKLTYADRKKLSKVVTGQLCEKYYGDDIHTYFLKYKKKDDLADCLLQCIDFIKKQNLITEEFYIIKNEIS